MTHIRRVVTDALGMAPHLIPLAESICLFGQDPQKPALAAIAVARSRREPTVKHLFTLMGSIAGLTEGERLGEVDGLTRAERSAVVLALGSIGCPFEQVDDDMLPDQHFTPHQIRQLQALALSVDLICQAGQTVNAIIEGILSARHVRREEIEDTS